MAGDRCVAEIQFADYIFNTMDLLKIAGNTNWVSNGNYVLPMTVMTPVGAGIRGSVYHSHSFDAWASRLPGWKVVMRQMLLMLTVCSCRQSMIRIR